MADAVVADVHGARGLEIRNGKPFDIEQRTGRVLHHSVADLAPQAGDARDVRAGIDAVGELDDQLLALIDAEHVGELDAAFGFQRRSRAAPDHRHVEMPLERRRELRGGFDG